MVLVYRPGKSGRTKFKYSRCEDRSIYWYWYQIDTLFVSSEYRIVAFFKNFFFTSNTHEKCPSLFVLTDIIQAGVFVPHRSLVSSTKKHLWNAIVVFAEEFYILFVVFLVLAGLSNTCHEVTSCCFPVVLKDLHSEAHFFYKPQCVWLYLSFLARWLISRLRHWKARLY